MFFIKGKHIMPLGIHLMCKKVDGRSAAEDERHKGKIFMAVQLNHCRQRLWCMMILCGRDKARGVQKPAHIPTAMNTTLAFSRGKQSREVEGLRFVHNESSMCVFVCM